MKQQVFNNAMKEYKKLCRSASAALDWYNKYVKPVNGYSWVFFDKIDDDNDLCFSGHKYWSQGGHEEYYFSVDSRVLYDKEYRKQLINGQKEKIAREKAAQEKHDREIAEKKIENEKATYLRLKEKYGE
jgi:hypothetical protein